MMWARYLAIIAALVCPLSVAAENVVVETCSFQRSHSSEGVMTFDGSGYRVVSSTKGLTLETRYADGGWRRLGAVDLRTFGDHRTYMSRHELSAPVGVMFLSITDQGVAVLLMHYGRGFNAIGSRTGTMFQGECQRP